MRVRTYTCNNTPLAVSDPPFTDVTLPTLFDPNETSVITPNDALHAGLEESTTIHCDQCDSRHQSHDFTRVQTPPPTILLQIPRPHVVNGAGIEVTTQRRFDLSANLTVVTMGGEACEYRPAGFVRRIGVLSEYGYCVYVHYLNQNKYVVTYDDSNQMIETWDTYRWSEAEADVVAVSYYRSDVPIPDLPSISASRVTSADAEVLTSNKKKRKRERKKDKAKASIHRDGDKRITGPCITATSGSLDGFTEANTQKVRRQATFSNLSR